jgi:LysM repeat protein
MSRLFRPIVVAIALIIGLLLAMVQYPAAAAPLAQSDDPVLIAAGDIVECSNDVHYYTAYLLESMEGTIAALGDNVYEVGSIDEYMACYDPSWGRFKDRTRPILGNHEYGTQGAEGYYTYFGDAATPLEPGCTRDCKGYYSYDLGEWHIVALNSETDTRPGSEQEQWFRADLAANPTACTLVYWHRPRFTSGPNDESAHGLYQAAYDYGADVLLVGHSHIYERFSPLDPGGQYDPEHGIRQFIVGTGGSELDSLGFVQPTSEALNNETWGVLKLTLHSDAYSWEFVPMPGQTFTDSGRANCVSPANPPADLAESRPAPATAENSVTLIANVTETTAPATPAPATPAPTAATPSTAASTTAATDGGNYIIQSGDTLFGISLQFGVLWTDIAEANNLTENSLLQIGQVIQVPGAGPAVQSSTPAASDIAAVDPTTPITSTASTTITAGVTTTTVSTTPSTSPAPTASTPSTSAGEDTYTIQSGDSIILIALANDLDWQELLELNGLDETSILQIGQEIRLR